MKTKSFSICFVLFLVPLFFQVTTSINLRGRGGEGQLPVRDGPAVRKDERTTLLTNEFGEISAVKISSDSKNGFYNLHFITINPGSLFLPTYLHSEMLFYVDSGNGSLSWMNAEKGDKLQQLPLQRGVIHRLEPETVFYIQNNGQSTASAYGYGYENQVLRIYAIFPGSETELQNKQQISEPYTGIHDLVLGFDDNVLQATFGVPQGVIEDLRGAERQPLIVEGQAAAADASMWGVGPLGPWANRALHMGINNDLFNIQNKNKAYDIYKEDHDIDTCSGWSVTVTRKELEALKHTDFGVFLVNLTKGSMMGPHWNPRNDEVAIVLNGQGMVEVVCPGVGSGTGCQNSKFRVEEGDVFVVPRSYPMAQISFNDGDFVFLGFRKTLKDDTQQTLAGKLSILQKLDKSVLEKSFNVKNTTLDWVFSAKKESYIYECISCAEEAAAESASFERGGQQGWPQQKEEGGQQGWPQQKEEGGQQGWPQQKEEGGQQGWPQQKEEGGQQGWPQQKEEGGQQGWPQQKEEGGQAAGPEEWQGAQGPGGGGRLARGPGAMEGTDRYLKRRQLKVALQH